MAERSVAQATVRAPQSAARKGRISFLGMRTISSAANQALTVEAYNRKIPRAGRFLFYSHDGLGLGHIRRNLAVATALAELAPQAPILVATSAEEAQRFAIPPSIDILKLPGLRKVDNGHYAARRLNVSWRDVRSVRASLLLAAVNSFRPTVLVADRHPLGVGGELEPALEQSRAAGAGAVLGLRDVLDDPSSVHAELHERGLFEGIARYFRRVLVYGQPDILDAPKVYGFPENVAAMTRFCGYVVSPRYGSKGNGSADDYATATNERPHVLGTAGGGEDGVGLLAAFVEAAAGSRWRAEVVSGPQCAPEDERRLGALASDAGVEFRRFVPELPSEFLSLDALVCMGGYNTLTEAAASGVSTVCVPRVQPRSEQLIRAKAFADRGLLTLVEPGELDAALLGDKVESALTRHARDEEPVRDLDLGGAHRAARFLLELAAETMGTTRRKGGIPIG
jgi:predicted glycosyltransferase